MSTELAIVPVAGINLLSVQHDGDVYVPMKPLSEALGLPWSAQHERIHNNPITAEAVRVIRIPSASGSSQETLCLPARTAFVWLVTVPLRRIQNVDVRAKVEALQRESFDAMYDYWTKGSAHNPRFALQHARTELSRLALARKHLPETLRRLERCTHATTHRIHLELARADCAALGIEPPSSGDYPLQQADLFDRVQG